MYETYRIISGRFLILILLPHIFLLLTEREAMVIDYVGNWFCSVAFLSSLFSHTEGKTTASHQRMQRTGWREMLATQHANIWFTAWRVCAAPWSSAIDWVLNEAQSMSGDLQQDLMLINVLQQWAAKVQLSAGHVPSFTNSLCVCF